MSQTHTDSWVSSPWFVSPDPSSRDVRPGWQGSARPPKPGVKRWLVYGLAALSPTGASAAASGERGRRCPRHRRAWEVRQRTAPRAQAAGIRLRTRRRPRAAEAAQACARARGPAGWLCTNAHAAPGAKPVSADTESSGANRRTKAGSRSGQVTLLWFEGATSE